jgi:hypothetical protein
MNLRRFCLMLALGLAAVPAWASKEELAGETETAQPMVRPTEAVAGDEEGPVALSRSAQAPTFKMPEVVIIGEGEAKALTDRGDARAKVDTMGGIQASPGEQGASKQQAGAEGSKQALGDVSRTAVPSYGQATLEYGLANTSLAELFYGRQWGDASGQLEAAWHGSDGARLDSPAGKGLLPWRDDWRVAGRGDALVAGHQLLSAQVAGDGRDYASTYLDDGQGRLSRSRLLGSLDWEGPLGGGVRQDLSLGAARSQQRMPGLGTAFTEAGGRLHGLWERAVDTPLAPLDLGLEAGYGGWSQSGSLGSRGLSQALLGLGAGFEPLPGSRFRVGVKLQSDGDSAARSTVALPQASWEQRLGASLGAFARFEPGQSLPLLSEDALFCEAPVMPSPSLRAQHDALNLAAGLRAAPGLGISAELSAYDRQVMDAVVWDDPSGKGVWSQVNAGQLEFQGLLLKAEAEGPWGLKAGLTARAERSSDDTAPSRHVPFHPEASGRLDLAGAYGPWQPSLALDYEGARWMQQVGGPQLDPYAGLDLRLAYALSPAWLFFVEGRNLCNMAVEEFEGGPDARPMAGLGATLRFH